MGKTSTRLEQFRQQPNDLTPYSEFKNLVNLLARRWTMNILLSLRDHPMRYRDIPQGIGIKPRTFARRMVALRKLSMVERRDTRVGRRRVKEYVLTPFADDLFELADQWISNRTKDAVKAMSPESHR